MGMGSERENYKKERPEIRGVLAVIQSQKSNRIESHPTSQI